MTNKWGERERKHGEEKDQSKVVTLRSSLQTRISSVRLENKILFTWSVHILVVELVMGLGNTLTNANTLLMHQIFKINLSDV